MAGSREASSSSDSEPELTQLRRSAGSGLLPEPVICVQPPSPLPSSRDSNSSPEEGPFQPVASKQYTFRVNEDPQEESAKKDCGPCVAEGGHTVPTGGPSAPYDGPSAVAERPKLCEGHGCEAGTPVPSGLTGSPAAGVSEDPAIHRVAFALHDADEEATAREELGVSRVDGPTGDSSPSLPHCPASGGKELVEDITPTSSATEAEVTQTAQAPEGSPPACSTPDVSATAQARGSSPRSPASDPAEVEDNSDPQVISPYDNVPSQSFFPAEESEAQTDTRHPGVHAAAVHPGTLTSPVEGVVVAGSSSTTVSSKICSFEDQHVALEPKQEGAPWEQPPASTPSSGEPATPTRPAVVGKVVITKTDVDSDSWSEIREDDAAFEARVKEEEQKIFGLMVDRQSQGTTPDTTPARTPTEEGTPTSEQNPFLFQEGKLFEMTRSGAIDMTKRSYADDSFHFFQIAQESGEEPLPEDGREGHAATGPPWLETEGTVAEEANLLPEAQSEDGEGVPTSAGGAPAPGPHPGVQVQLEFCTVTRSVHSGRDEESPDSSPEEQKSVIEIPTAPMDSVPSAESKPQTPLRTVPALAAAPAAAGDQSAPLPQDCPPSLDGDSEEEEAKPKSKIPVKAPVQRAEPQPPAPDSSPPKTVAPWGQDTPGSVAENRSKSESDSSPRNAEATCPAKARSCPEAEAEGAGRAGEPQPGSEGGAARPKPGASRLPVKTRGPPAPGRGGVSPTKERKEHFFDLYRNSIEFFEEISDEASRLVDRLTQSEREQESLSDDESSSALEVSVIENLPPAETEHSVPEDIFDTRPIWDESIETLIERIPDENGHDRAEGQQDEQERIEERLAYIADHLGFSWTELARELDFTEEQIHQIRIENPNSLQDQSHALLKYWLERDGKHATDTSLIECLTKINRMDIVHLMETSTEPLQDHTSRSSVDTGRTTALDDSEGFSALPRELCGARPEQAEERAASEDSESHGHPPIVSDEDLSISHSALQDCVPKADGDSSAAPPSPHAGPGQVPGLPAEPWAEPPQEYFVTTPGTEVSDTQTAAPGSPGKTPVDVRTAPEEDRPYLQPPASREQGDAPIVQEPEERPQHGLAARPRRTSLVIVESADDQALASELPDEDAAFQKGDDMPDIPPETVTEEEYVDEHGHKVVKKVTRKIIRRYVSPDGTEKEEVTMQGPPQELVSIDDGDSYSRVIKRVVLKSDTEQSEVTLSEPSVSWGTSQFQAEPVEGRKVSKVIKTTMVRGERLEKHLGDSSLATDLPSAKDDFEEDHTE